MKKRFLSKLLALAISAAMVSTGCFYHALPVSAEEAAETQQMDETTDIAVAAATETADTMENNADTVPNPEEGNQAENATAGQEDSESNQNAAGDENKEEIGQDTDSEMKQEPDQESDKTQENPSDSTVQEEQDPSKEDSDEELKLEDESQKEEESKEEKDQEEKEKEKEEKESAASFSLTRAAVWDGVTMAVPSKDADGVYLIGNGAELKWLQHEVSFRGKVNLNATLTADIDLGNQPWEAIGNFDKPYAGVFDGANHRILNLYCNVENPVAYAGVFGRVKTGCSITNLTVEGNITGNAYTGGGIAGCCTAENNYGVRIINCVSKVNITIPSKRSSMEYGGIAGFTSHTLVKNCANYGTVIIPEEEEHYAGGIVGHVYLESRISSCKNEGAITGGVTGGIVGLADIDTETIIEKVYNTGTITGYSYAGGLVGDLRLQVLRFGYNRGQVLRGYKAYGCKTDAIGNSIISYNTM
ncbi:MAG: hypothetical protein Q4B85_14235, partial [Lachnospiraceae bacterium]|nr:hypothetical protein [Lachnospiraceae bacterium]